MSYTKIDKYKNETTYRFGKWLVKVERKAEKTYACGMSKTTTWNVWSAINMETFAACDNKNGVGGIKEAIIKLA